ncbi:MAG: polyribonucleotide nucleotidyltransferase [Coprothermobacterota bacterium]|nr:polyribonucleotide nucleotidyltransferase [Coprothermobacterota bacterium]
MTRIESSLAGQRLTLETGKLAKQAGGAVLVTHGETVVLATATLAGQAREGIDYLPLMVDYEEKMYSIGKIPGGFFKREGRPTEKEILRSRLIDRSIRPLFASHLRRDIQVVAKVLSADPAYPPDIAAMIAAGTALSISEIPFEGPVAAMRLGAQDGKLILNPTYHQIEEGQLDLVVAATDDAILMVEAGAKQVSEELLLEGLAMAQQEIRRIIALEREMMSKAGKEKTVFAPSEYAPEMVDAVKREVQQRLCEAIRIAEKQAREDALATIDSQMRATLADQFPNMEVALQEIERKILKEETRAMILREGIRPDGRTTTEIRPITCEVGVLPRVHGSGLFTRGQTQVLTILTLGAIGEVQIIEGLGIEEFKRYMHHYNFPPFSVGEVRPMRGPGRREIGHGSLAERALLSVIPSQEEFPYTIRLVSEVLESNGSTSMASVCGSTLALLDAGVPITTPIAGIAMGLIKEKEQVAVLTDIQGMEDALGDMDFKVAGSASGVTALQMDMKIKGIELEVLRTALTQAKEARLAILEKIWTALPQPRSELSRYAPRVFVLQINPDKIRDVIGPGGKMIKKITEETGAMIDIEQSGRVFITAPSVEAGELAKQQIEALTGEVEIGATFTGKVSRVETYGVFMEISPGKEGLLHKSRMYDRAVKRVEESFKMGDELPVIVDGVDDRGRISLTRKGLTGQDFNEDEEKHERRDRPDRSDRPWKSRSR